MYHFFKKRREPNGDVSLLGFYPYEETSILFGQMARKRLLTAPDETTLQGKANEAGFPVTVAVLKWFGAPDPDLPDNPPDWFDPADAGEHWHEDDY